MRIGSAGGRRNVRVRIGNWPTGLYFARLTAKDGRVGFAPFTVRPHRLGEHRVAVVLPTLTWQAYNLRDDDGDGTGDTWYADWRKPPRSWAGRTSTAASPTTSGATTCPSCAGSLRQGEGVDVLSDADLEAAPSAAALARAYDLIVFPGHHEYVTTREYDLVEGYRDRGGNLAFLSANNFFWQVVKHGRSIEKTRQWRDLAAPRPH